MANILTRIAGAAAQETASRSKDVLATAFPLLTAAPYQRALMSLPGMGFASAVGKRAGIFQTKENKQKKEEEKTTKQTFTVLENILGEVVKIREAIAGPLLKPGYIFEKGRGKGKGGFKSLVTGRYVAESEAVAEQKPSLTVINKKSSIVRSALLGIGGYKVLQKGVKATGATVVKGAATAGRAALGIAAGGLKLGAILTALAMFLPKDMKSVIGSIFEGLLEGIGFNKETIEAIFTPFRILSDIAELIKKVLGVAWDFAKWILKALGSVVDWFSGRSKVNAAEEVSKATSGTGHGEFTTGGEVPAYEPPGETGRGGQFDGGGATGSWDQQSTPPPAAAAASVPPPSPAAAAASVPPPAPAAPTAAPAAPPPTMLPSQTLQAGSGGMSPEEKKSKIENIKSQINQTENQVDQIDDQILKLSQQRAAMRSSRKSDDPDFREKGKEIDKVSDQIEQLEEQKKPLLQQLQSLDLQLMNVEKQPIQKQQTGVVSSPPAVAAPSLAAGGSNGGASGSGAGGSAGGGGGGDLAAGGGDTSAPGAPAAASVPSAPTTGQEIGEQSKQIEADRMAGGAVEGSTNIIDKGEFTAGTQEESAFRVPSPAAPRQEFDLDIFFTAAA